MRVLIAFVFLLLLPLFTCSQLHSLFRNEAPVLAIKIFDTGECLTPKETMDGARLIFEKDPIKFLARLKDTTAVHFMEFYHELYKWTPHATAVVADEIWIFDRRSMSPVVTALYKNGCLVALSSMEDSLFNQVMLAIGAVERKPWQFTPRPGERDV